MCVCVQECVLKRHRSTFNLKKKIYQKGNKRCPIQFTAYETKNGCCGSIIFPSKQNHSSNHTKTLQPAHMVLAVLRPAKDKQNVKLIHMDCNVRLRLTGQWPYCNTQSSRMLKVICSNKKTSLTQCG